ncbi:hypothetical protein HPC49_08875 [Pyxidicoccus fallax]|uniref:Lipoprotein n=1 Tax=Pyxidicoccus fallax TaxID=394095 RepID=A0A848L5I1_9BACT|nr:hypothetical protein [Pyxidicoccus fallax]NMO13959.1 hypothetical protein [Pyxidicoccus fallax]NPC78358.1 hypothetical protein [Pyxidicoccus fallax]
MIRNLWMSVVLLPTLSFASPGAQEPLTGAPSDAPVALESPPTDVPAEAQAETPPEQAPPAEAVTPPAPERPALSFAEAKEQYELRHIGFDDYVAMQMNPWTMSAPRTVARWTLPYEGKYKKPLEGKAFYEKLGRADLVEAYNSNMRTKTLIGVAGGGVLVGGALVIFGVFDSKREDCDAFSPDFSACMDRNSDRFDSRMGNMLLGSALGAAGAGMMVYAVWRNPHPVDTSKARELADAYNKQLQSELGISDEPAPRPRKRPSVIQASVTPTVGRNGGGLLLNAVF